MNNNFEEKDVEKFKFKTWKRIISIVIKNKSVLIAMILFVILSTVVDICYPLLNRYVLETYFEGIPSQSDKTFVWVVIGYVTIVLSMGLSVWGFIYFSTKVEEATTYEIRMLAFDKIQKLSFSYFDTTPSGWLMARMTSDARKLSSIISWSIVDLLWGVMSMIGILIISFVIDFRLALILVLLIPIFFAISIYCNKKILKEYREVRKINSSITAMYNESFMGANTTKTLVLENDNNKSFNKTINRMRNRSIKASVFSSLYWPTILFLGYIGIAVVLGLGANLVEGGKWLGTGITVATLYLFVDYSIKFFDPVMMIARVLTDLQQAQASAERVLQLIDEKADIEDTAEVIEKYGDIYNFKKENWEKIKGDIEFKNVTFNYKNTDLNVLENFNLEIKSGQMIAFVGETGSGKSTIVNLICRFYEPTEGDILFDGKSYKERSQSWLHANLGYVLQTPQLFSGTIKDNIRYGKLDATDEEIIHAAKLANAHEFITKLENGYDTFVGESGNKLSLGEKQLISFARAVVSDPSIIVLDEATSSIDTENEKTILEAIQTVLKNRTSLVIAHRLSTVVDADKIIVLRQGKILESGTHKELLAKKGYYFELYKNQFMQELENQMINNL